jgi:hypothetical protein
MPTCIASLLKRLRLRLINELVQEKPEVPWGNRGCMFWRMKAPTAFFTCTTLVGIPRLENVKKSDRHSRVPDLAAAWRVTTLLRRSLTS